jgi:hypothetical protein
MNESMSHAELIEGMTAKVAEAFNVKGEAGALPAVTATGPGVAGASPAVRGFAVPWSLLWPMAEKLAPSAVHAALGFLSARFGPRIAAFLDKYESRIRAVVDPGDWAAVKSVLSLLIPANLASHLDSAIRPMFGATFAAEVPSMPSGAP